MANTTEKYLFNNDHFCDIICIMKNKISFLAILAVALGVNYASASECIDDDCELNPEIVVEEYEETPEPEEIEEVQGFDEIEFLQPHEITETVWATETKTHSETQSDCEYDFNCPFETAEECEIWYKKPVYKQDVNPRGPRINPIKTDDIIYKLNSQPDASANDAVFAPLVDRYKMLMRASKACCTEGIIYKLHAKEATDEQIYKFLKDDANRFAVGSRCLVMNNDDLASSYSNGVDRKMVSDVRGACLCKNRKWFDSLLAPFGDIYNRVPEFKSAPFNYTYVDGLNREITVSINTEVQNTVSMINSCPD